MNVILTIPIDNSDDKHLEVHIGPKVVVLIKTEEGFSPRTLCVLERSDFNQLFKYVNLL